MTHSMVICAHSDKKQWKQEQCASVHQTGQCQDFTHGKVQEYVTYPEPSTAIFQLNNNCTSIEV
jgi:hypothetical protein